MTMTDRHSAPIPLDEALKALDSPEAIADRRKRATKRAEALRDGARGRIIWEAGTVELAKALYPLTGLHLNPSHAEVKAAEIEAGHGVDRLVLEQCMIHLRAEDMAEIYRDPDRMESERIWQAYLKQVSAFAFQQGNQSDRWVAKWRALVEERASAELDGDPTGPIERRLDRHVGYPYPQLPEAAWAAADLLPASERDEEYRRLTAKYGPRTPPDAPKRRGRR